MLYTTKWSTNSRLYEVRGNGVYEYDNKGNANKTDLDRNIFEGSGFKGKFLDYEEFKSTEISDK